MQAFKDSPSLLRKNEALVIVLFFGYLKLLYLQELEKQTFDKTPVVISKPYQDALEKAIKYFFLYDKGEQEEKKLLGVDLFDVLTLLTYYLPIVSDQILQNSNKKILEKNHLAGLSSATSMMNNSATTQEQSVSL